MFTTFGVGLHDVRNKKDLNRRTALVAHGIKTIPGRARLTVLQGLVMALDLDGDQEGANALQAAVDCLMDLRAGVRGGPRDTPGPSRL